jgi:hypothetical protein
MPQPLSLTCALRSHVITDEGDFLPAGTPVQVIGWTASDREQDDSNGGERQGVEVRAEVYMHDGQWDWVEVSDGRSGGSIHRGLNLTVDPENLVYLRHGPVGE